MLQSLQNKDLIATAAHLLPFIGAIQGNVCVWVNGMRQQHIYICFIVSTCQSNNCIPIQNIDKLVCLETFWGPALKFPFRVGLYQNHCLSWSVWENCLWYSVSNSLFMVCNTNDIFCLGLQSNSVRVGLYQNRCLGWLIMTTHAMSMCRCLGRTISHKLCLWWSAWKNCMWYSM